MEQASIILFWVSFAGFTAASVLFGYQLLLRRTVAVPPQLVTGISAVALTGSIGFHSSFNEGTPLTGANQLILAAWALVVLYFVIEYGFKFKTYGGVLVPIAVAGLGIAQIVGTGKESIAPVPEVITQQMDSAGIGFHVLLIVFANALFIIGSVASALYLYQDRQLRTHGTGLLARRLPSLANLERLSSKVLTSALPIYLAGQLLGMIRAINVDAQGWWADPRIMMSGLVFFVFSGYAILFMRNKTSGAATAWIAVVGGVLVIILMIVARTLPIGFHVFGVIT